MLGSPSPWYRSQPLKTKLATVLTTPHSLIEWHSAWDAQENVWVWHQVIISLNIANVSMPYPIRIAGVRTWSPRWRQGKKCFLRKWSGWELCWQLEVGEVIVCSLGGALLYRIPLWRFGHMRTVIRQWQLPCPVQPSGSTTFIGRTDLDPQAEFAEFNFV